MTMEKYVSMTKIILKQADITKIKTEAIVNAANSSLRGGSGVNGAIHRVGGAEILEECIGKYPNGCPTGECRITNGGNLPADYVIHCVGPRYHQADNAPELLQSCYNDALKIATQNKITSIGFPSISTGAYGYPIKEAANIAVTTIISYLEDHDTSLKKIYFIVYSDNDYQVYEECLKKL